MTKNYKSNFTSRATEVPKGNTKPRAHRSRNACFTSYKISTEYKEFLLKELECDFVIFQVEQCPETQKLHYQGYVEWSSPLSLQQAKNRFEDQKIHIEPRRGSQKQAIEYCSKLDSRIEGPFKAGCAKNQGMRRDFYNVKEAIDMGATEEDIAVNFFDTWIKYHNAFKRYFQLKVPFKNQEKYVEIRWGLTNTGKSHKPREEEKDLWIASIEDGWFDGYTGQEAVLFEEFEETHMSRSQFLQLTDKWATRVPVKHGFVNWCPKRIYFTSNKFPDWYGWTPEIERRIDTVIELTKQYPNKKQTVYKTE